MPFDVLLPDITPLTLYRERREAAAELWRSIPPDRFNLRVWCQIADCGTTACALGWLAERQHDDWAVMPAPHGSTPYWKNASFIGRINRAFYNAAEYFGITDAASFNCFDADCGTLRFYGVSNVFEVTPVMVADKLLALDYHSRH